MQQVIFLQFKINDKFFQIFILLGKSTLLNTIAGRIKKYTGSVQFFSKDRRIAFAYVPQVDQLTPYLTVKESLLFSSKLKNPFKTKHIEEVEFVLTAFNLWKAKNHFAYRCSGGERKRLSIGLEMISKPKILILGTVSNIEKVF